MITYPDDYNPVIEYVEAIENHDITVPNKIEKTYQYLARVIREDDAWHYNFRRGNHILEFFENFVIPTKGQAAGKPIVLELWEKAFLAAAFGIVDNTGHRRFSRVILIVGKKNGKSALSSGVGMYLLMADGENGPDIYSVATTRDQAKIIWEEAKKMRNKSVYMKKYTRATISDIVCPANNGTFKPLASNVDNLDGLNVFGCLMDEFQQWKNGKRLYDIMADGTSSREEPLIFMTSTAGVIREDIYDETYDEAAEIINGFDDPDGIHRDDTLPIIYELDARSEWDNSAAWIKANPNLGISKKESYLANKVANAKANPKDLKDVLCKEFNIRETSRTAWMSFDDIDNRKKFDIAEMKPKYGVGGFDLSITTDLTCAMDIFMVPGDDHIYVDPMFWLPEDLLDSHVKQDRIPYDKWRDMGYLRLCSGNKINQKDIYDWFQEVQREKDIYLPWIGYDSWSASYLVNDMKDAFGAGAMEAVVQGKKTLSQPMKELGADLQKKRIIYNNNPILKWCMTNVGIDEDINGNIQPVKSQNSRQRIDGFATLLDAYIALQRHYEEYISIINP
jgi:phage terminase large subunit-like protein